MSNKEWLLDMLRSTREETIKVLEDTPGEMVVHTDSAWRVQDICVHLTVWDQEVAAALRAHARGETYMTLAQTDMEGFNQQAYEARLNTPYETVRVEMAAAHAAFVAALEALSDEQLAAWLIAPWGPRQTVEQMVVVMVAHEKDHRREIEMHQ